MEWKEGRLGVAEGVGTPTQGGGPFGDYSQNLTELQSVLSKVVGEALLPPIETDKTDRQIRNYVFKTDLRSSSAYSITGT